MRIEKHAPKKRKKANVGGDRTSDRTEEETGFVSLIVLCELVWVLNSGYGYAKVDILRLLRGMASTPALTLEHHERVSRALSLYEKNGAGLADCLIVCS